MRIDLSAWFAMPEADALRIKELLQDSRAPEVVSLLSRRRYRKALGHLLDSCPRLVRPRLLRPLAECAGEKGVGLALLSHLDQHGRDDCQSALLAHACLKAGGDDTWAEAISVLERNSTSTAVRLLWFVATGPRVAERFRTLALEALGRSSMPEAREVAAGIMACEARAEEAEYWTGEADSDEQMRSELFGEIVSRQETRERTREIVDVDRQMALEEFKQALFVEKNPDKASSLARNRLEPLMRRTAELAGSPPVALAEQQRRSLALRRQFLDGERAAAETQFQKLLQEAAGKASRFRHLIDQLSLDELEAETP